MQFSTQQQRIIQAITEDNEQDLMVLARAGTGKTTTILAACAQATGHVAFFAFNKAIADELKQKAPNHVDVSTLHSLGFFAVRQRYGRVRVDADKVYKICKQHLGGRSWDDLGNILKVVSLAKNLIVGIPANLISNIQIFELCERYEVEPIMPSSKFCEIVRDVLAESYAQTNVVDFDDMIAFPCYYELPIPKYDWVFLDEAQDVNPAQMYIVDAAAEGGRLCIVGDPKQAIYGFRGADENAMDSLMSLRGKQYQVYPLTQTFRCPKKVVAEAVRIVPDLEAHKDAIDGHVGTMLLEEMDAGPGDMILSRTNAPLISLYFDLIREGKPAKIQGRDVGQNLLTLVKKLRPMSFDDLIDRLAAYDDAKTKALMKKHENAPSLLETALTQHKDTVATLDAIMERCDNLADLNLTIQRLFADVRDTRSVTLLSTIHKAKGLEAPRVYYLQVPEIQGPQEANLRYVAITRAQEALWYVSMPDNGDNQVEAIMEGVRY